MAGDGRVVIDVILDDGKVVKGVADVKGQLGGIGKASESSALSIGKMVTALGLVAVARKGIDMVTSAIGGAVARVDTLNGFPVVMERMGFSSDQAKASIDKLSNGIQGLPTTLDGIVKSTQNIALMTGDLDVATDTALALNNAFLASGSSATDAERGLVQYVQMLSKGKVDMVSWQTLQETMGFALNKTAEAFGFTGKSAQRDLYEALKKGHITFDEFNAKLIELNAGVGGFADIAQAGSAGIATSFTNMKTAVVRGTANIIQALQDVLAKTPLQSIENILGLIGKAFGDVLNAIAAGIPTAVDSIMNLYNTLEPWLPLITSIAGAVGIMVLSFSAFNTAVTIIGNVRKAIIALNASVLANPWTWVALAAITAVLLIIQYWEPITQFFQDLWSNIIDIFNNALNSIQTVITALNTAWSTALANLSNGLNTAISTVSTLVTGLFGALSTIPEMLNSAWSSVTSVFTSAINALLSGLSSLKEKLSIVTDIINLEQALNLLKMAAEAVLSSLLLLLGPWGLLANIMLKVFTHTTLLQDTFAMLKGEMTFDEVASNFSNAMTGIIENITELTTRFVTLGAELIVSLINGVSNNIGNFATAFAEILPIVINTLVMIIPQLILLAADMVTSLANGITNNLPLMVNAIVSLIELVTTTIGTLLPQLIEVGVSLISTIVNGIVTALPIIIEVVVQLIETFINAMTTMLPMLIEIGLTIVETLLNGIITALPLLLESALNIVMALVDAITSALPQLLEVGIIVLNTLMEGIVTALPLIIESALNIIMTLVNGIISALPQLIAVGLMVLNTLIEGIIGALPIIIESALTIIMALVGALILLLPKIIEAGLQILMALVEGLIKAIPALLEAALTLIMALVDAFIKLLPQLIDAGIKIVDALVKGLIQVLPQLIQAGITLIMALLKAIIDLLPQLLSAGVQLIAALVKGVLSVLGQLLAAGGQLILGLLGKILSFVGQLLAAGVTLIGKLISGILSLIGDIIGAGAKLITSLIEKILSFVSNLLSAGKDLVGNLIDGVLSKVNDMINVGKDLVNGLINGITQMGKNAVEAITGVVDGVVNKAKSLLGIHSPSRVFKQIGAWTSEGWAIGIEEKGSMVKNAVSDIALTAKDIAEYYVKEEKKLRSKANEDIKKIEKDKATEIAKIEKRMHEDVAKAQRAAASKKKKTTQDDALKIQRIKEDAAAKILKLETSSDEKIKSIKTKSTKEIVELESKMNKDLLEETKRYIDDKKSLDQLSLIEEAQIWEQSMKLFAEGTKERVKAQQEYKKATEAVSKEITAINTDFSNQIQKINDDLIKQEETLTKAYADAVDKRAQSLVSFKSLFDAFKLEIDVTGEQLIANLFSQVDGFKLWQKEIEKISEKAIDKGLLEELRQMGPNALPQLVALNQLTDQQLQQYSNLYKEKSKLARTQAETELKGMKDDTDKQIKSLRDAANKQLDSLQKEWNAKIKSLTKTTSTELSSLQQIGKDAGQGLLNGLASMESPLQAKAKDIADSIKKTIQSALDIHSPSRWMRDFVAGNMAKGFVVGVDKNQGLISKASEKLSDLVKPDVVNKLRGVKANIGKLSTRSYVSQSSNNISNDNRRSFTPQITNYYTPSESTPSESARKQEQLLRRLAMEF